MKYHVQFGLELQHNPYKGFYIALEGIDGAGKTTQIKRIAQYLKETKKKYIITREPTRDRITGKLIHHILQEKVKVSKVALQHLFVADRAELYEEVIAPALKDDKAVISDRCFWSSIPYGMADRGVPKEKTDQLFVSFGILSLYHEFTVPDVTLYIDVSVKTAMNRLLAMRKLEKPREMYEKKDTLIQIKKGYDLLLEKFPKEIIRIDGEKDSDEVTKEILKIVKARFIN